MSHAVLALGGNVGEVETTFCQALRALREDGVEVLTRDLCGAREYHAMPGICNRREQ